MLWYWYRFFDKGMHFDEEACIASAVIVNLAHIQPGIIIPGLFLTSPAEGRGKKDDLFAFKLRPFSKKLFPEAAKL